MTNFDEIINTRCSNRGYTEDKLTAQELESLVKFGLKAPTARNEQELFFSVVSRDSKVINDIGTELNPDKPLAFLYGAPTLIIISGKDDFKWADVDAGIAVENIHLGAVSLGLGSVIIGCIDGVMHGNNSAKLHAALGVPDGYTYKIAIAVGHPSVTKAQHEYNYDRDVAYIE